MPPVRKILRDSSGDSGSDSDSGSASSVGSSRSASPASHAPADASVHTDSDHSDSENRPRSSLATSRAQSRSQSRSKSRSPSVNKSVASPKSHGSPARSLSQQSGIDSPRSNNDDGPQSESKSISPRRERSASVQSEKSQKSQISRSPSPNENTKFDSPKSQSSQRSNISRSRSRSKSHTHEYKSKSPVSPRSNVSGSPRSKQSASPNSRKLSTNQSSPGSRRSTTPGSPKKDRSRSGSLDSQGSQRSVRSKSPTHSSVKLDENTSGRRSMTPPSTKSIENNESDKKNRSPDGDGSESESKKEKKSDDEGSDIESSSKRKRIGSGSGSDNEKAMPKKLRALIDSDTDDEIVAKRDSENKGVSEPTADALFGDASDISTDDEKDKKDEKDEDKQSRRSRSKSRSHSRSSRSKSRSRSRSKSRSRSRSRGRSESGDDRPGNQEFAVTQDFGDNENEREDEPEPPPETRIDVEIPKISTDLGREIHFVKLPNFLSVETRPFDHETYEDEIDEEETLDEEGRARLKLKVENTIRWREVFDDDGKLIKESNARFVKWSDGSMSLHLGSEIFDVYKQSLQGDHNHLYIRQGTGLQGQAVFRTKLTFRPHSTESFTHRKMTMSLADRSQKTSGIKVLSQVGMNPDQNRYEMIKKEEEKLRMAMRVQSKVKKSSGVGRSATRSSGGYGGDAYHDDGSDDEGAISLAAIKNKYKKGGAAGSTKAANIYSSDEEGSDFEMTRSKKNFKGKVLKDSDDSNVSSESASGSGGEAEDAAEADSD